MRGALLSSSFLSPGGGGESLTPHRVTCRCGGGRCRDPAPNSPGEARADGGVVAGKEGGKGAGGGQAGGKGWDARGGGSGGALAHSGSSLLSSLSGWATPAERARLHHSPEREGSTGCLVFVRKFLGFFFFFFFFFPFFFFL